MTQENKTDEQKQQAEEERKKSISFLKLTLILVAILLIIYTIVVLVIFLITGSEPTTLTQYFFDAFKIELVACAAIKIFQLKWPDDKSNSDNNSDS